MPALDTNRLAQTYSQLLQVLEARRVRLAAVAVGVQDLLAVAVQIQEAHELDVVVGRLVADEVAEGAGLDALQRGFAGVGLGAGVADGGAVPLEGEGAVEIEAEAEAEGRLLPVLAPETVGFPGVGVAVRVEGRDEEPVEVFEELGDFGVLAVFGDHGVGDVSDRADGDPFPGVDAAGDEDGFAGRGGLVIVCGVDADAEGGDVAPFVCETDVHQADVSGEKRRQEAHPGGDDRQGLVVGEEDVVVRGGGGRGEGAERGREVAVGMRVGRRQGCSLAG